MDIPHGTSSVPVWVWIALGLVVLVALSSRGTTSGATTITPAPADTSLQQAQLQAQTALAATALQIAGTEDVANIQARSQEVYGQQSLRAIQLQGEANTNIARASNPPPAPTINVTPPDQTASVASRLSASRARALSDQTMRASRFATINNVAGALGSGVRYAQAVL